MTNHAEKHSDICKSYMCEQPERLDGDDVCVDANCRECMIALVARVLHYNVQPTDVQRVAFREARNAWSDDPHFVRALDLALARDPIDATSPL
jgi:hypothetical protein